MNRQVVFRDALGGMVVRNSAMAGDGVWRMVDADAATAFTPWVFAIGHAMFGAVTGLVVGAPRTAPAESTR
ncbi:hypothetical protein [Mycobacterium sp.]|uniref:hypothetical protein n=1 Tax=Mycobacterium sp. TaxID=1785 RepID=UPI00122400A3|nr:hypothetical protein [Mycobacterium sp.]TAM68860.1 MAG: hypothetical protein EPN51_11485 [Mycobacterium sp.]